MTTPRIYVFVPYCHRDEGIPVAIEKNGVPQMGYDLGAAYQRHMALVPDDGWGLLIDHQVALLTSTWFRLCEDAIATHPDTGMFTCMCTRLLNRGGFPALNLCGDPKCHDMRVLRKFALEREKEYGKSFKEISTIEMRGGAQSGKSTISGFFMLISKKAWNEAIMSEGDLHGYWMLDKKIHNMLLAKNFSLRLIEGLVVYHWLRGIDFGKGPCDEPNFD